MGAVSPAAAGPANEVLGRYALYDEIASGGMATVHLGRVIGDLGFARTVAIKRLLPQYAKDPEFVSMFVDEARLAARIIHPNVVSTIDAVTIDDELFLVMEYVHGDSIAGLLRSSQTSGSLIPPEIAVSIACGILHGLHAAHEARGEDGLPLGIVHRDVSPPNVIVGVDGVTRVLDFGIAKAAVRAQTTREGQIKGKLRYMAPEQLRGRGGVTRQADIYSTAVVVWELLTSERLFSGESDGELFGKILEGVVLPPSSRVPSLPPALDDVVLRALDHTPERRFASARDMAKALERVVRPATPGEVGEWVERTAGWALAKRAQRVAFIEGGVFDDVLDDGATVDLRGPITHTGTNDDALARFGSLPPASVRPAESREAPNSVRPPPRFDDPADAAPRTTTMTITRPPPATPAVAKPAPRGARALFVAAMAIVTISAVALARLGAGRAAVLESGFAQVSLSAILALDKMVDPASSTETGPEGASVDDDRTRDTAAATIKSPAPGDPRRRPPPRAPVKNKSPDCNPPYVEDATGFRHVKRECL